MDAMAFVDEQVFDQFEKMAEYAAMCPADMRAYEANLKAYRDLMGQLEYAATEGEARGEAKAKHEMIFKLAQQGVNLDIISNATGFTLEEIKQILSSVSNS